MWKPLFTLLTQASLKRRLAPNVSLMNTAPKYGHAGNKVGLVGLGSKESDIDEFVQC